MVAGGGASVAYSDAIAATGFAHEPSKDTEYSPSVSQTFEYAKAILDLLVRPPPLPDGKALIIGGDIAKFTDVAATFKDYPCPHVLTHRTPSRDLCVLRWSQLACRRSQSHAFTWCVCLYPQTHIHLRWPCQL
ncbi:hypothetical protein BDR04DRAFT_883102 [Suillus decipiens]|nr:hypothetical protein BDR04DRAFT_883102 [Suillus decipiens]